MISFAKVWSRSNKILGAFSPAEARILYDQTIDQGEGANLVEIGSYCGRSSSLLGQIARLNKCDLTCIDCFITLAPGTNTKKDMLKRFRKNMWISNSKYELMEMKSEEAIKKYDKEIDLLFIDGDHTYEGVKKDCELRLPKLKVGGCVLFHDYEGTAWPGVKKAVDEFTNNYHLVSSVESIIAKLKE